MKQVMLGLAILVVALLIPLGVDEVAFGDSQRTFKPDCIKEGACLDLSSAPELCGDETTHPDTPAQFRGQLERSTCVWPLETEEELAMTEQERRQYINGLRRMAKNPPETGCIDRAIPGNEHKPELDTCVPPTPAGKWWLSESTK